MRKRSSRTKTILEKLELCELTFLDLSREKVPVPTVEELAAFYESILTRDWIDKAANTALFFVAHTLGDQTVRAMTEQLIRLCADADVFDNYCTAEELNRKLDLFLEDWPVSFILWILEEYAQEGLLEGLSWKPETLAKIARARLGRSENSFALLETMATTLEKLQGAINLRIAEAATAAPERSVPKSVRSMLRGQELDLLMADDL